MLWWTLRRLRSSNPDARRRAAAKLYKLRDARTVGALIAALGDFSSEVRTLAARALGEIGLPRTVGPLMAALKDWNSDVRLAAMEALVKLGGASVEPLLTALMDQDGVVRRSAAEVLGKIKDARAMEPLLIRLADQSSGVRRHVARALEAMGWRPENPTHRVLWAIAAGRFEEVVVAGAAAVEPLVATLTIDDTTLRVGVARALGELGDTRAIEPLAAALTDLDDEVQLAAAEALARLRDARALEPLVTMLWDADSDVRKAASAALEALGWQPMDAVERARDAVARREWNKAVSLGGNGRGRSRKRQCERRSATRREERCMAGEGRSVYSCHRPISRRRWTRIDWCRRGYR